MIIIKGYINPFDTTTILSWEDITQSLYIYTFLYVEANESRKNGV